MLQSRICPVCTQEQYNNNNNNNNNNTNNCCCFRKEGRRLPDCAMSHCCRRQSYDHLVKPDSHNLCRWYPEKKTETWLSGPDKLLVKTPNDGGLPLPTDAIDSRKQYGSEKEDTMSAELQCCFLHWGFAGGSRF
jgi:hypothetical protein